ncbi:MAG: DUF6443 domain-containing protein [Dysgonamonadaceae bacterium]|jgi:RHS repeat-associated protein|nr:DUF6443 domain-containing protein [Dysgonamonadaceae bacterium]
MKRNILILLLISLFAFTVKAQPEANTKMGTLEFGENSTGEIQGIPHFVGFSLAEAGTLKIISSKTSTTISGIYQNPAPSGTNGVTYPNLPSGSSMNITLGAGEYVVVTANAASHTVTITLSTPSEPFQPRIFASQDQNYIRKRTYTAEDAGYYMDAIQYYDGLGRPIQQVQAGISPTFKDLVTYQEYDAYGRNSTAWLPTVAKSNMGAFIPLDTYKTKSSETYNSTTNKINNELDTNPYVYPIYENSPLNCIKEQYGPGQAWRTDGGHPVKTDYLTNNASHPCRIYSVSGDNLVKSSTDYVTGSLYIAQITDEDGKIAYEFTDKLGRVILQRQMNGTEKHDTYFVYDDLNNLRFVLPPAASDLLTAANTYSPASNAALKDYAYIYQYDDQHRCIEKKLPGADPIFCIYDKTDRLIFSQDGEQRLKGEWMFSIPDIFGRIVLTGTCKNTPTHSYFQDRKLTAEYSTSGSDYYGYVIRDGFVFNTPTILSVNYYDNYDFRSLPLFSGNAYNYESNFSGFEHKRYGTDSEKAKSKGLLTGTITSMMDDTEKKLCAVFYYDDKGRVIQSVASNHLGGHEKKYIDYSFTGQPTKTQKVHRTFGSPITEIYEYSYDHANRPKTTLYQLDTNPAIVISSLSYDDLGRVKTKKLHKDKETITYTYNIRNWLSGICSANFSESLYYTERYFGVAPLYNGNIAVTTSSFRGYAYTYDGLNRLTKVVSYAYGILQNHFNEELTYDKQGNILSLKRNEPVGSSYQTEQLYMNYTGNQLTGINPRQGISSTMTKNTYNKNGALTSDLTRNISQIEYNTLNLPEKITFGEDTPFVQIGVNSNKQHTTEYSYDATGVKRRVKHTTIDNMTVIKLTMTNDMEIGNFSLSDPEPSAPSGSSSDPSDPLTSLIPKEEKEGNFVGISRTITDYCGNIVYENGNLKYILNPEGYVTKDKNTPVYHYYLKDHLGNNRVVIPLKETYYPVVAVQKMDYYPFGKPYPDEVNLNPEKQPYKFGNKELDEMHGLNQYDFVARQFRRDIPIFDRLDPLAEDYYRISPYAYCLNNPVLYIDPTGESVHLNKIGNVVADYDDDDDGVYTHNDLSNWDNESILAKSGKGINNIGYLGGTIDMSNIFINRLVFSKKLALNMDILDFGLAVRGGSYWDFKANWDPEKKEGDIWGYAWYFARGTKFIFEGYSMTAADFGNFHYGYTGKFTYQGVGMPDIVLETGAGAAEIGKNVSEGNYLEATKGYIQLRTLTRPYGDSPIDNDWIREGMRYAEKKKRGR